MLTVTVSWACGHITAEPVYSHAFASTVVDERPCPACCEERAVRDLLGVPDGQPLFFAVPRHVMPREEDAL